MLKRETTKKTARAGSGYLADEQAAMTKQGYITVRSAADLMNVRVDRVYRAIKNLKVRVKLGDNQYTRYVHKGDWLKFMEKQRGKVLHSLGLDGEAG